MILVIILEGNGLNASIKSQIIMMDQKTEPTYYRYTFALSIKNLNIVYKKTYFIYKNTYRSEVKNVEKIS